VVAGVIGALIALVIANIVGDALTTTWAEDNPLALIALNSRNRVLVLTTNQLDPWSYYGVATLRLLAADPLFYLLGRWYGDAAIRWVERKWASQGQVLRWFETAFSKAAYPIIFLAPNNPVCLFAGATGMPVPVFLALNISGTMFRLFLIRVVGATFESPIDEILDFFGRYRLQLFVISVALVILSIVLDRGGGGEIEALRELEHELTDDEAADESE
jgi:membrane protein DedA with SNARE-associated domain